MSWLAGAVACAESSVSLCAAAAAAASAITVAVVRTDGEVVIRARSASRKLLKSVSRYSSTAATGAVAGTAGAAAAASQAHAAGEASGLGVGLTPSAAFDAGMGVDGTELQQVWNTDMGCYTIQQVSSVLTTPELAATAAGGYTVAHLTLATTTPDAAAAESDASSSQAYPTLGAAAAGSVGASISAGDAAGAAGPDAAAAAGADGRVYKYVAEGRRVTGSGPDAAGSTSRPCSTAGGCTADGRTSIPLSRSSTKEAGAAGSSRASTPNRGFFAGSTGNAAFNR